MTDMNTTTSPARSSAHGPLFWAIAILLMAGTFIYVNRPKPPPGPSAVAWAHDLDQALADARKAGQNVLVVFHAVWCNPCVTMDRKVWPRQDVADALADWVTVKIDIDKQSAVANRYGVRAVPTVLIFASTGKLIDGKGGLLLANEMIDWVSQYRQPTARAF